MQLLLLLLLWGPQHEKLDVVSTGICNRVSWSRVFISKVQSVVRVPSRGSELCPQLIGAALELHSPPWPQLTCAVQTVQGEPRPLLLVSVHGNSTGHSSFRVLC